VKALVKKTFKKLYDDQLIYRDYKLVNWDVVLKTAISDIEIIHKETNTKLYYIKYYVQGSKSEYLTIATTRPETIYADCCIFVNPSDSRYKKYINQFVINPLNQQLLKVMSDNYIDKDFGTGVMKCTPAHDFNDYELAIKHKLKDYVCAFNNDGTLNEHGKKYQGVDRLMAREQIVKDLANEQLLVKVEQYDNQIGYSERTNSIIEPMLSLQWFIKMKPIAKQVLGLFKKQKPNFLPPRFEKTLIT
jgi:valyl-tRNA synthetase